ncbi:MAG: hypothetical protein LUE92_10100 [Clostridiales bacterium]|nr:hypothetical protein [Clostridiales bacterium]
MDRITLYGNLFFTFLAACIGLSVLAGVLFFILDIRSVSGYLTGRMAKRKIQQMEEEIAQSGRLFRKTRNNMQYVDEHLKADMGISGAAVPGARKVENLIRSASSLLRDGEQAASLLQSEEQATSLLQSEELANSLLQSEGQATLLLQSEGQVTSLLQNGEEVI